MENFDWTQFTSKIGVKASMQIIYNVWAKPEELERWFLSDATYKDTLGNVLPKQRILKPILPINGNGIYGMVPKKVKLHLPMEKTLFNSPLRITV